MSGINHIGNNRDSNKPYPGCLGRMVNLFELNKGLPANKLLTDKPHRDVSPLSRSRSDASRMSSPGDSIQDKVIVSEFANNNVSKKISNATPMKMLIAQEMSKEVESKHGSPNLVAKLMGLDSIPRQQQPELAVQRSRSRGHHHPRSHSDIPPGYWERKNGFFHHSDPNEYRDVFEIWHQSQVSSPRKETANDKKMAFVRQKFVEVKRLSMDEKHRQSKQFHDALEVLSSNKDLFLECLQEPNSMFAQTLSDLPTPETKRITILRPSKMADKNEVNGVPKNEAALAQTNALEKSYPERWKNNENPVQPTRIVVLKPSTVKANDVRDVDFTKIESPKILINSDGLFGNDVEEDNDENQESREVAKAITQKMREKLGRHRRDETLISSVFSNGYVGDDSSFNKSEYEYADGNNNLSDTEVASPVSRHSWDYVNNRVGSPYSSSSFSRASYSPESSVCREAKKRLSERWAMMASSNGIYHQEPTKHVRRSSSTLGEMLALSEAKNIDNNNNRREESSSIGELGDPITVSVSEQKRDDEYIGNNNSPRNLTRSKSVPVSSTEFGDRLNFETVASNECKSTAQRDEIKTTTKTLSLKGKVSSLFFSRSKRTAKDKSVALEQKGMSLPSKGEVSIDGNETVRDVGSNNESPGPKEPLSKASFVNFLEKQGMLPPENELTLSKPIKSGILGESPDQPSPLSVLDPPFEADEKGVLRNLKHDQDGNESPPNSIGSRLIGKSPPIGCIARTLTWDDSCNDTASSKETLTTRATKDEDEQECFLFVKTLLSVANLQESNRTQWHSPDSPLDPSLRDKYVDSKDREILHEAKRRQKRSTRKLIFDCVNEALVGIDHFSERRQLSVDKVWENMRPWFSFEPSRCVDESVDDSALVVERLVRKEVAGKVSGGLRSEVGGLCNEIEGKLIDELVLETVVELTGRV